jgi:hypothetical protein
MSAVDKGTHRPVAIKGLTLLWTKDDGSLSDVHLYFDEALIAAQLGHPPKALQSVPPPAVPSGTEEIEKTRAPAEGADVKVVRDLLEAYENRNETSYLAALDDDVDLHLLETVKPLHGKNDLRQQMRAAHKAIAQLDTSIDNVWGIGQFVVVEYHVVGEQRAPIGWIPSQKDNLIKMFIVDLIELRGGKVAHVWRYDNPAQILPNPG